MNLNKKLKNETIINLIQDDKFSEVYSSLKVLFPLEKRVNTIANLLVRMMGDRLENTPTKTQITHRLDMMYGTKSAAQTYAVGAYQVIDLSTFAIHDKFVGESLQQAQLDFLADSFYAPLLNEATLTEAKHNLQLSFDQILDHPSHFAMMESFIEAGKGQIMELTSMGLAADIEGVTLDEVKAFHQEIIAQAHKQIYCVGDVLESSLNFDRFEEGTSTELPELLLDTKIKASQKEVFYDGTQTELVLIYETDITPHHPLYNAYLVYIALLGQLPTSLLFQNIREKHSLAYSIYATRRMFDGVFAILTGINDANLQQTLDLIQVQIDSLKTEVNELEEAKNYLILQLEGIKEKQKPWSDHVFRNHILGVDSDVEEIQEGLASVTVEQVIEVANKVKAPFVYAYRGIENEAA